LLSEIILAQIFLRVLEFCSCILHVIIFVYFSFCVFQLHSVTMLKNKENVNHQLELELEELCRLDLELAAEVERKTVALVLLCQAVAEAKGLALAREAEWLRRQSGCGG
jgi:hypothetical protein